VSSDGEEEITVEQLARRGNITSDNHRPAVTCQDCRTTWYGRTNPFEGVGQVATEYCPYCGGRNVEQNGDLPGTLLLNPGVEWPEEDPFVGEKRDDCG
jgi:hypothetical protein